MNDNRTFPRKGYAHTIYVERYVTQLADGGTGEPVAHWDPPRDSRNSGDRYFKYTMTFDYLDRSKENHTNVYVTVQNKTVTNVSQKIPVNLRDNFTLYNCDMITSINRNRRLDDDRCISTAQRYPNLSPDVVRKITRCEKFIAASQRKIAQYKVELAREEKRLEGNYVFLQSLSQEHGFPSTEDAAASSRQTQKEECGDECEEDTNACYVVNEEVCCNDADDNVVEDAAVECS